VKPTATLADIPVVKAFVIRYLSVRTEHPRLLRPRGECREVLQHRSIPCKNGDVVGLQRELGLKPSQQVDMVKVNAATANMVRLQGIKNALGESAQLVRKIDQNPGIAADEKRQLIDTIYGAMIRIAHAGNEGFAAIDAALKP